MKGKCVDSGTTKETFLSQCDRLCMTVIHSGSLCLPYWMLPHLHLHACTTQKHKTTHTHTHRHTHAIIWASPMQAHMHKHIHSPPSELLLCWQHCRSARAHIKRALQIVTWKGPRSGWSDSIVRTSWDSTLENRKKETNNVIKYGCWLFLFWKTLDLTK